MFSSTVIRASGLGISNVRPTPSRAMAWEGSPSRRSVPRRIWPRSARVRPLITLKSVVLPAPFGPMRPVIEPSATARVQPARASTPPKRLVMPVTVSSSAVTGPPWRLRRNRVVLRCLDRRVSYVRPPDPRNAARWTWWPSWLALSVPDRLPDAFGRRRHLDVLDAQLGERVDDRIDHGAERRRRPAFAAAAQAERMGRRGHLADLRRERGQHVGARHGVVHQRRRQQLTRVGVVVAVFPQRLPDALSDAAVRLAVEDHRID